VGGPVAGPRVPRIAASVAVRPTVEVEINARWGASNFVVVGLSLAGEFYASAGGGVNCWVPASGDRRTLVTASIASEDVLAAGASTASHAFARARSLGLCLSGPTCPVGCPSSLASARRAAPGRTVQRGQLDPMEVCGGSMSPSATSQVVSDRTHISRGQTRRGWCFHPCHAALTWTRYAISCVQAPGCRRCQVDRCRQRHCPRRGGWGWRCGSRARR
jgi:hypothetical protein